MVGAVELDELPQAVAAGPPLAMACLRVACPPKTCPHHSPAETGDRKDQTLFGQFFDRQSWAEAFIQGLPKDRQSILDLDRWKSVIGWLST